jgi:hypothetical protein
MDVMDMFGQDIRLDESGQAVAAANGELLLTEGVQTGLQDLGLRLKQPLGELFYDIEFGTLVHEFYLDEDTQDNRMAFEAEVERRIEEDPRTEIGTAVCTVTSWNETGFQALAVFEFIGEENPYNLAIAYDSTNKELVVKDVNPRSSL